MKAFHGDIKIKRKYLARVRAHRKADELIKGIYWQHGKGCAVGCTVHTSEHSDYEKQLGIPIIIAQLEDGIFEGLPNGEALSWPERFLDAITPGQNLSQVGDKFLHWLLMDETDGVIRFAKARTRKKIKTIGDLYACKIAGETIDDQTWQNAASAAARAARDAERAASAAASYAASAAARAASYAESAARYAASYAESAASYASAAASYAASAAARAASYAESAARYAASDAASAASDASDAASYAASAAARATSDAASAAARAASATSAAMVESAHGNSRIRQSEKLIELLKSA